MTQPSPLVTGGTPYILAPGIPLMNPPTDDFFADPLEAFQALFNDGQQFDNLNLSFGERAKRFLWAPIRAFKKTTCAEEVDEATQRVAHFSGMGKLKQAARASYALGDTYWNHFLIRSAERAYFFGAAVSIGMGNMAVLTPTTKPPHDKLFAEMIDAGVAESRTAPPELNVGSHWPVFTPLLHGGKYDARTQKYAGLGYVRREFRHEAPVQSSAEGTVVDTPIDPAQAEQLRDGELGALRAIQDAGIRVPDEIIRLGKTAYVRTFVEGEIMDNLSHAAFPLTDEQVTAAAAGYGAVVTLGVQQGVWKVEPPLLKKKTIFDIAAGRPPTSPENWVVIEP